MLVRGSVDVVMPTEVRGWAFAPGRSEPVLVQAVLNHEILGETAAKLHRPDLAEAGLGDGRCGYAIDFYRPIDALYLPFIEVKVDGGDAALPRAPMLGFAEFFSSLHAAYPVAGRHRSVFGGLWTDRTDARALLRGKVAIGQVRSEIVPALAQLVDEGYAVLPLKLRPSSERPKNGMADATDTAVLLEDAAVLPVLNAVLEDNPLALPLGALPNPVGALDQPSVENVSGSPAECLLLVAALRGKVRLDIVRDSHRLPEFTRTGLSRWAQRAATEAVILPDGAGMLESVELAATTVAVIGAGTLYRLRHADEAVVLRVLCLPGRATPVTLARQTERREVVRESGVLVWA